MCAVVNIHRRQCGSIIAVRQCGKTHHKCYVQDKGKRIANLNNCLQPHKINASHTQVMPLALLKSTGRFSIHEASCALEQDPVIRSVLTKQTLHLNT